MTFSLLTQFPGKPLSQQAVKPLQDAFAAALHPTLVDFGQALVQEAALPFYQDFRLYSITDLRLPTGTDYLLLARPGKAVLLNGESDKVYAVNALTELVLNQVTVCDYVRFFFAVTRGPLGPSTIVEKVGDLPWLPEASEEEMAEVTAQLVPLTCKEHQTDGRFLLRATVLFHDSIYGVDIIVAGRTADILHPRSGEPFTLAPGMVLIANEERLVEELQVATPLLPEGAIPPYAAEDDEESDVDDSDGDDGPHEAEQALFVYPSLPRFDVFSVAADSPDSSAAFCSQLPEPLRWPGFNHEQVATSTASLPFYPGYSLVAMIDKAAPPPNIRFVISGQTQDKETMLMPITGTNEPIYALNDHIPLVLTEETLRLYARLFFYLVRGRLGTFFPVEHPDEIDWLPDASEEEKAHANSLLQPITYQGLDTDGLHTLTATVVFKNALFKTDIKISGEPKEIFDKDLQQMVSLSLGQVKLENEEVLMEGLHVIVPSFSND